MSAACPIQERWHLIYPQRDPEITLSGSPGQYHLHDQRNLSTIYINDTAATVWQLSNRELSVAGIIELLSGAFDDSLESIACGTLKILDELSEKKIIELYQDQYKNIVSVPEDIFYHEISPALLSYLETFRKYVVKMFPQDRQKTDAAVDANALKIMQKTGSQRAMDSSFNDLKLIKDEFIENLLCNIRAELALAISGYGVERKNSGQMLYGAGGWMGWHTNEDLPGRRVYCNWSEKAESNFFRYLDPINNKIITSKEPAGWIVKSFYIPAPPEQLWHCLQAGSRRIGLGFAECRYKRIKGIGDLDKNTLSC